MPETGFMPSTLLIDEPELGLHLHGSLVAMDVGFDAMKGKCPHFAQWLEKLERLKSIEP